MNMIQRFMQSMAKTRGLCHPDCVKASSEQEDYDASQLSIWWIMLGRKTTREKWMNQALSSLSKTCISIWWKMSGIRGKMCREREQPLTVKDCLECAFKKGLPRREHWAHVGCTFKAPPFACHIPRVPMKGEVIETKSLDEAFKLLIKQPVGARLHVFSPDLDNVGEGVYEGLSSLSRKESRYVGLRDVIIVAVNKSEGKTVATVKICYKKKTSFVKVCLSRMFVQLGGGEESQVKEPTGLLVDFCIPRLSIN
ncbi:unnamed protein product [Arabidopsis thaliana]|uniref:Protein HEAT-INDUCED TAS1 TARGET 2 n=2 Tax=Arabidopsis TaxID=3701 RepID=HTT2_ARATH|nr:target of trans acting-siR480/255 protein [Arabidopsis thaliana]Q9FJF8.1 RecName: Full=Protein HEAT-INDUCED TAS1 TARGET 2 [Arabidopsis thaliana]KAG7609587.1 hypothetical protein ISN44_As05g016830 [Arabidopsis suecica]AAK93642.1 unknown protein [Arabidopsis thaliana]AAM20386.1 unknown protein [Arabidopsis thaliana]AED92499.1 target of trans acting-siR480/255 protein [Arabidopsis thaliana]BAB08403.1 unnamed protein product [Arabidopsis thaliana]|eukprot:NP_197305.1 target of trans acting-siR480/255 protein [Arabidopsis thaliana]